MLGTIPDREVAERTGLTEAAVLSRRRVLKIAAFVKRKPQRKPPKWTPTKYALLGTAPDHVIARKLRCSPLSMFNRRRKLGFLLFRTARCDRCGIALPHGPFGTEVPRCQANPCHGGRSQNAGCRAIEMSDPPEPRRDRSDGVSPSLVRKCARGLQSPRTPVRGLAGIFFSRRSKCCRKTQK